MIDQALKIIETVILPLGGFGVFMATMLEEAIAPIPSSAVLFLSGFLFLGNLAISDPTFWGTFFFVVVIPAAAGMTIGSLLIYFIFYFFGKKVIERWGKYFGITLAQVEKVERRLQNSPYDELVLIVLRAIPFMPVVPVTAVYGTFREPLSKYLPCTFAGAFIRSAILGLLGWATGEFYYRYAELFERFEKTIFIIIILLAFFYALYRVATRGRK